jgi:hypothetical protein
VVAAAKAVKMVRQRRVAQLPPSLEVVNTAIQGEVALTAKVQGVTALLA